VNNPIRIIEARIRQMIAMDNNAKQIYSDLADQCQDPLLKEKFHQLALEEAKHGEIESEILSLLANHSKE